MDGAHRHQGAGLRAYHFGDALAHLARRFVRERHSQNAGGVYAPLLDQVGGAVRDRARLARPRARHDSYRPVHMPRGLPLLLVQSLQS